MRVQIYPPEGLDFKSAFRLVFGLIMSTVSLRPTVTVCCFRRGIGLFPRSRLWHRLGRRPGTSPSNNPSSRGNYFTVSGTFACRIQWEPATTPHNPSSTALWPPRPTVPDSGTWAGTWRPPLGSRRDSHNHSPSANGCSCRHRWCCRKTHQLLAPCHHFTYLMHHTFLIYFLLFIWN